MTYSDRERLEATFGKSNVSKWADLDGTSNAADIESVISTALEDSQAELDDRLRNGPYKIPFESPYPRTVVRLHTLMCGVLLYEARGVTDSEDGKHQLQWHRKKYETMIRQLHAGHIKLDHPTTVVSYPQVVLDEEEDDLTDHLVFQ